MFSITTSVLLSGSRFERSISKLLRAALLTSLKLRLWFFRSLPNSFRISIFLVSNSIDSEPADHSDVHLSNRKIFSYKVDKKLDYELTLRSPYLFCCWLFASLISLTLFMQSMYLRYPFLMSCFTFFRDYKSFAYSFIASALRSSNSFAEIVCLSFCCCSAIIAFSNSSRIAFFLY